MNTRLMIRNHPWAILMLVLTTLFLAALLLVGRDGTFAIWGLRCTNPDLADAHGIVSGIETMESGADPLVANPNDPWQRPFNYPRVWLALSLFGIGMEDAEWIGYAFTLLFFAGLAVFPPAGHVGKMAFFLLGGILSPAVMLGLERGNSDLLMFFLLSCAVAFLSRDGAGSKVMGGIAILSAFVLKIYPILGAAIFLSERKVSFLKITAVFTLIVSAYLLLIRQDMVLIHNATPKATGISYGIDVLWMEISQHSGPLGAAAKVASRLGLLLAFALLVCGCLRSRSGPAAMEVPGKVLASFRAGACVYCGTFILGNNWDYRLVFLLFTIPYLVSCASHADRILARISKSMLCAILVSLWHITIHMVIKSLPFGSEASVLLDEACNWIVFLGLSYLLGMTFPGWIRDLGMHSADGHRQSPPST